MAPFVKSCLLKNKVRFLRMFTDAGFDMHEFATTKAVEELYTVEAQRNVILFDIQSSQIKNCCNYCSSHAISALSFVFNLFQTIGAITLKQFLIHYQTKVRSLYICRQV